ncbi:hypothetical protein Poli38472_009602 [Pythium oligandrum]|uniref:NADH dehydrogenase [ubiquinone] 1 alpha subcomplex subunit 12 n=1 Tax=Pythium oligandrum TaxID=41045 RepID=A0A8K1CER8_PYTOL|nr:hypothetical protein Poli38472_009602 [Pythium oligandrum]|eukprot:TMW62109.1 hypothetical protein Poli38472_009602 [Pythium oligandrum]
MTTLLAGKRLVQAAATTPVASVSVNVQKRTFYGVYEKYMEAKKRYGWKEALWKLSFTNDIKFGYKVGEDEFGNSYFEDPTEFSGMQRYTEFRVGNKEETDASQIPPQWHVWLHQTTDAVPGQPGQDAKSWEKVPVVAESHAPYENHVGPSKPFKMHPTLLRARGYGVDGVFTKAGEPDQYYVQPGHLLRRRHGEKRKLFEEVDYNNPEASKDTTGLLRPLDVN